jgi:predicted SAM-dependent methyltransferase
MILLNLGCGTRNHPAWVNVDLHCTGPGVIPCDLRHEFPFADSCFDAVYHSHLLEHFSKADGAVLLRECFRVLKLGGIIRIVVPDFEKLVRLYLDIMEKAICRDHKAQKRYDWIILDLFDQLVRNRPGGDMLEFWKQNRFAAEDFVIERCGSEVLNALSVLRTPSKNDRNKGQGASPSPDRELDLKEIGQFRLSGEVHQWVYDRYSLEALLKGAGFLDIRVCHASESEIPNFNSYLLDIEPDGSVRKPDSLVMEARKE